MNSPKRHEFPYSTTTWCVDADVRVLEADFRALEERKNQLAGMVKDVLKRETQLSMEIDELRSALNRTQAEDVPDGRVLVLRDAILEYVAWWHQNHQGELGKNAETEALAKLIHSIECVVNKKEGVI